MENHHNAHQHTTYQLLVESEEKQRGALEGVAYLLLIVATSVSIWQFSHEPVTFTNIAGADSRTAMVQQSSPLPG
ncbi:MAG: hypothetical protein ABI795_08475 [Chthoniobacterales bacterium]